VVKLYIDTPRLESPHINATEYNILSKKCIWIQNNCKLNGHVCLHLNSYMLIQPNTPDHLAFNSVKK